MLFDTFFMKKHLKIDIVKKKNLYIGLAQMHITK